MVKNLLEQIEKDLFKDDFYYEEERKELLENDEISSEEDAFMRGYDEAG